MSRNIDHSIEPLVHSVQHDLFMTLPREFDLAVMDRLACYLPGWEMPKTGSEFLKDDEIQLAETKTRLWANCRLSHTSSQRTCALRSRPSLIQDNKD